MKENWEYKNSWWAWVSVSTYTMLPLLMWTPQYDSTWKMLFVKGLRRNKGLCWYCVQFWSLSSYLQLWNVYLFSPIHSDTVHELPVCPIWFPFCCQFFQVSHINCCPLLAFFGLRVLESDFNVHIIKLLSNFMQVQTGSIKGHLHNVDIHIMVNWQWEL